VNPTTFVTLKINARTMVGTESRFNLTTAMIRSPSQRTGNAYNATCSSRNGQIFVYSVVNHHRIRWFRKAHPEHSRRRRFSECVGWERGARTYLESMGFAGRDGCGANDSETCRQSYVKKTHITALKYPVAFSVFIDLRNAGVGADASSRLPGDMWCGTHLVPVSQSDQDPSRNILEWKRISLANVRIPDMKLPCSSRSPSTAAPPRLLSVGRGFTSAVRSSIPLRSLGMRLRFGTHR
jgi:hypothetical protein